MQFAERYGNAAVRLEISVERTWILAMQYAYERRNGANTDWLARLGEISDLLERANVDASTGSNPPVASIALRSSAALLCGLLKLWSAEGDDADEWLQRGALPDGGQHSVAWLLVAQSWVQAEMARRAGDLDAATMHVSRMSAWATEAEHLPLACIGHRLASDIHLLQGRHEDALRALQEVLSLERRMQVGSLDSREYAVDLLVAARQSERQVEALAAESSQYKQWAYEDALTGLANLRRFDQCLTEWSGDAADTGRPLCVALIDVNKFKKINDTFTHPVGDKVLRAIARQMVTQVRETDLPARWGGDEFAILFPDTEATVAEQVTQRLERAIRDHDWNSLAEGLQVSVSVGVVAAQPGDTKQTLVSRSDKAMYARKHAHHLAEVEDKVPKAVIETVKKWLHEANQVVVLVGAGTADPVLGAMKSASLSAWSPEERRRHADSSSQQQDSASFASFWQQWRQVHRKDQPTATHLGIVELSHRLKQVTVVTERTDGLLAKAGALDVIELYGNAFRDRCCACGTVRPSRDNGRCLACNSPDDCIGPDIVLLGEKPDAKLLAGTELAFKNANLVLIVESDVTTWPSAGFVEKARTRGAKVVMIGTGRRTRRDIADVSIPLEGAAVLNVLVEALSEGSTARGADSALTPAGLAVLCYLTGQGVDDHGTSLDDALGWSDWEIERRLGAVPWMFPLLTRSQMNPRAPMPTRADFAALARDENVRQGMRRGFARMLRFYGFEWRDGTVERANGWVECFSTWALTPCHHDLFISRILGSLTLCGLKSEAQAFLQTLEREVVQYRRGDASVPLHHWRLALRS